MQLSLNPLTREQSAQHGTTSADWAECLNPLTREQSAQRGIGNGKMIETTVSIR